MSSVARVAFFPRSLCGQRTFFADVLHPPGLACRPEDGVPLFPGLHQALRLKRAPHTLFGERRGIPGVVNKPRPVVIPQVMVRVAFVFAACCFVPLHSSFRSAGVDRSSLSRRKCARDDPAIGPSGSLCFRFEAHRFRGYAISQNPLARLPGRESLSPPGKANDRERQRMTLNSGAIHGRQCIDFMSKSNLGPCHKTGCCLLSHARELGGRRRDHGRELCCLNLTSWANNRAPFSQRDAAKTLARSHEPQTQAGCGER
jgi:hypothetical protein